MLLKLIRIKMQYTVNVQEMDSDIKGPSDYEYSSDEDGIDLTGEAEEEDTVDLGKEADKEFDK